MTIAWLVVFSLLMQSKLSHFADTPKVSSVFLTTPLDQE